MTKTLKGRDGMSTWTQGHGKRKIHSLARHQDGTKPIQAPKPKPHQENKNNHERRRVLRTPPFFYFFEEEVHQVNLGAPAVIRIT